MHDWGHFEWTPTSRATKPPAPKVAAGDNDRTKIDKSLSDQGKESRKISNAKVDISMASTQSSHWQHMFKDVRQHQTPPMGKAGGYGGNASNQHKEE
jgi:hypothetical protein